MKKTFKKLFAALLAAALVLAMAVPAFAETNAPKGSITISNTVKDETYTIYRMFKLDSYNAESNTYSYTVESDWEGFFKTGAGKDYIDLTNGHPTWNAAKSQDSDKAEFAKLALKWATENKVSAAAESQTSTGSDVIFPNLDLGYYLVDSSLGALCGLNTTKPNVTITEKNGQPTIEKEVKNGDAWDTTNDAKIGDTVEFKITIHVKAGAQNYVVTDTMDAGLSFSSGSIQVDGVALNDNNAKLTLKQKEGDPTFTLAFNDSYVAGKVDETIVVTYTATLNKDAVVAGNKNSATLHYGNKQTVNKETTTYTHEFDLVKVDGTANEDGTHTLLNGAKFKLYETKTSDTALRFVKNADGSYRVALDTENGENVTDTIVVNGKVHISGLDKVNYWLDETLAPDGYNKLTERQEVKLSEGSQNATLETGATTWAEGNGGVVVENNAGTVLPSTGGMGTTLFYVIGGGLMVAAVVLLVTKKRMEHKN